MQRIVSMILVLVFSVSAFAVEGNQVRYVGGTIPGTKPDAVGAFALESESDFAFDYQGGKLTIPYRRITQYNYTREVTVHLGVVAAIAVSMVKRRSRQHFVEITFTDDNEAKQVAVFEVSKSMPMVVMPVLQGRAPCAIGSGYESTRPFADRKAYGKQEGCPAVAEEKTQMKTTSSTTAIAAKH
ncbi:MAG TPA: hypothetical protein VGC88_02540 [Terriglobales bacterium]|jgi:hypothetical protein